MQSVFLLVPDLNAGGGSAAARLLALGLPRDRFRVAVGVLGSATGSAAEELRNAGVAVHSVPIRNALDLTGARRLRRAVRDAAPAVLHAFGAAAARVSRLVVSGGDGGNVPRLVVSGATNTGGGLGGWLTARQIRRADRITPATRAEGERYRRLSARGDRLTRIAPAAPSPAIVPDRAALFKRLGVPSNSLLLVAGARAVRGVGPKDAIVAFDMLRYDARDLRLVVFGAGGGAATLEQFGRALAFDDFRVYFPECDADRAAAVRVALAVLVTDPDGGVDEALEAMAAGKPVVGWETPDLAEVVEDGATGYLVPVGDRAALAANARVLIDDHALATRMGEAGQARAAERFSAAKMVEQFSRVYAELGERPA